MSESTLRDWRAEIMCVSSLPFIKQDDSPLKLFLRQDIIGSDDLIGLAIIRKEVRLGIQLVSGWIFLRNDTLQYGNVCSTWPPTVRAHNKQNPLLAARTRFLYISNAHTTLHSWQQKHLSSFTWPTRTLDKAPITYCFWYWKKLVSRIDLFYVVELTCSTITVPSILITNTDICHKNTSKPS